MTVSWTKSPEQAQKEKKRVSEFWKRNREAFAWSGILSLLLISLGLRVYHLTSGHFHDFSHDIDSHLHFVQYVRSNWELPPVNLELEDAQQPLYYIIAALFYQPQLTTDVNIDVLGPLGLCISTAGLCLVCRALFFISSWIVRYGVFIYFAFTPAFIITSCVVGNDVLFSFFGAYFFLCVLRFNRTPSSRNLALLMLALTGALFSKLGGIVLLAAIPWVLWRSSRQDRTWHPTALRCALFALLVSIWAGLGALRAWDPAQHRFFYYNGWIWDYTLIKENPIVYASRFDLSALIQSGQATTIDNTPDSVRFSFPTWEYGNMLLTEYNYTASPQLLFCSRLIIIIGTYLLFGLLLFFFTSLLSRPFRPITELLSLNRTVMLMLIGAILMLLTFVAMLPNTCSADFRYLFVISPWVGFAACRGLSIYRAGCAMRTLATLGSAGYAYASVWLVYTLYRL